MAIDNVVDPLTITTLAEFGEAWSRRLEQAGMSQRGLADKAAKTSGGGPLSRPTISDIVNGRRLPSREQQTRFLALVGVTEDSEREAWDETWTRLNDQQSRFGSQSPASALSIGAFLESGPKDAAVRQLRRSIPEAAAELEKIGPGSAATILCVWPDEIVAGILAAMDTHAATAILLARPRHWSIAPVLRKMPLLSAAACLQAMGDVSNASHKLGWVGPWFLPKALRGNDQLFAQVYAWRQKEAKIMAAIMLPGLTIAAGFFWMGAREAWMEAREARPKVKVKVK